MQDMTADQDELALITLFKQDDLVASRTIFERYYRPLCYFAERLTNSRQEAQDIVSDVFIKLMKKRADFNTMAELRAFLYTATRNACTDLHRQKKRHQASHEEISYLEAQHYPAFELELINVEVMEALYLAIERLPAKCGQVFKLLYFEGLTTDEVATQMNISTKTVLNQKGKAIHQLRKVLHFDQ